MVQDLCVKLDEGVLNIRVGAIILKEGKFLMAGNERFPHLYSVGGRIKFGETAEEAVVREVFEETGVEMEVDRLGFIHENLETDLSIQSISRATNISKSVLYKAFHSRYSCTVGAYINEARVERSLEYLLKTNLPMEEIAQKVGFSSGSYYSKTFKKQMGISPLQYRKNPPDHNPRR